MAPQGYEEERIYKPAIENKADKVILLVTEEDDQSVECRDKVVSELESEGVEVEQIECDIFDPNESMKTISEVIYEHPEDDVKVNIATGSKITAISGMLACMLAGATPYYVKAKDYGDEPVSQGVEDVIQLPAYPIEPPEEMFVRVLDYLDENEDEKVNIKNLIEFVHEEELDVVEGVERSNEMNIYDLVNDKIIEPLKSNGYIRVRPIGGSKNLSLTSKGRQTLKFSRHLID